MNRLNQLLQMAEQDTEDAFIKYALAKEYETLGENHVALAHYRALEAFDPKYVGLYYHLGKLYEKLEDFEAALSTYQKGLEIAKSISDFHAYSELNTAKTNLEIEM